MKSAQVVFLQVFTKIDISLEFNHKLNKITYSVFGSQWNIPSSKEIFWFYYFYYGISFVISMKSPVMLNNVLFHTVISALYLCPTSVGILGWQWLFYFTTQIFYLDYWFWKLTEYWYRTWYHFNTAIVNKSVSKYIGLGDILFVILTD